MGDTDFMDAKEIASAIKKVKSGWASRINTGMLAIIMFSGWHYGQKLLEQIEKQDTRITTLEIALSRLSQQVEDMASGFRQHIDPPSNPRMRPRGKANSDPGNGN